MIKRNEAIKNKRKTCTLGLYCTPIPSGGGGVNKDKFNYQFSLESTAVNRKKRYLKNRVR